MISRVIVLESSIRFNLEIREKKNCCNQFKNDFRKRFGDISEDSSFKRFKVNITSTYFLSRFVLQF